jgi:anaerobic selenocysteine-containing dehydrogenase
VGYGDTCFGNTLPLGLASVTGGKKNKLGVPGLGTSAITSDYDRAKYGVCVGRNPGGGLVAYTWAAMYGRGRNNGLQVTFVDPRRPAEAGEGPGVDWLPIKPGTDLAFFLGLMHEIIVKQYYDEAYLKKYTNADMLVYTETLQPLSIAEDGDYLVYDKAGGAVTMKSQAGEPALRGEFDHDGLKVATGLELIARQVKQYTPEWAEGITSVPAAAIRKVAARLDEHKPHVFVDRGYRSERYENSLKEKHLNIMLNVLLGDFGREGGVFWNRRPSLGKLIKPPKPKDKSLVHLMAKDNPDFSLANLKFYRRPFLKAVLEGKPYETRMIITWGQNPVGGSAGANKVVEALKKVDTVVCISPYFNETTMYADVILPDAIYIERDEAIRAKFKSPIPTLALNRKAVDPLFDVKSGYWIVIQLAKRTLPKEDYEKYFKAFEQRGIQALWDAQLAKIGKLDDEENASFDYDYFLENGVWTGKRKYKVTDKGTPTHKLELYSTFFADTYAKLRDMNHKDKELAHPLPVWVQPYYMSVKGELDKDEFIPITGFSPLNTFTGAQTKNNPLLTPLMERLHVPAVWLNANRGRKLGLKDGDRVEIVNVEAPESKSFARVKLSQLVHPDTVFTAYGVGAGYYRKLTDFLRFAPKDGFNPNHVSKFRFTGLTGGMPSQDFIVKLRRV